MTTINDQERAAYMAGDIRTADLIGQLMNVERDADRLERLEDESYDLEHELDGAETSIANLIDALETAVEWAQEKYAPDDLPRWVEEAMNAIEENRTC